MLLMLTSGQFSNVYVKQLLGSSVACRPLQGGLNPGRVTGSSHHRPLGQTTISLTLLSLDRRRKPEERFFCGELRHVICDTSRRLEMLIRQPKKDSVKV